MKERLRTLVFLETMLDSDNLIFKYNENVLISSSIKADFLLEGIINNLPAYLFLGSRKENDLRNQRCRTFFQKSKIDYSNGQPRYTLLEKQKIRISDGTVISKYIR